MLENYGMKKDTFTSCAVQYKPVALLYSTLLDRILRSQYLLCLIFIVLLVSPLSNNHVISETVVALRFLTPCRLKVTTIRGSLLPLDKLKLLSNFGSFSMASLC